ncbi:hypothetical protein [Actinoplanes nipponensis]|uniref:hypothetical protein n=1 Tax=Actinoplanes nipponensis TaxID=135950 RepID=UPI00194450B5|nr:hypothetical protein [Actinoplanes nipponensis]
MIWSFAAAVARYRRRILIAALVISALAVTDAVRRPNEPVESLAALGAVAALALVAGAVVGAVERWRAPVRFEIDSAGGAFRTARAAAGVFLVIFLLAALAFFAEVGGWSWAHGDRDGGWVVVMAVIGVPVLLFATLVTRGLGIALTPEGVRADRETGRVFIPWSALAPAGDPPVPADQPRPAPAEYRLDLVLADPGRVTRRGLVRRPDRIAFEVTPPAFVAAAVRHYADHPAERATIGTEAGHRRLLALLDGPAVPAEPPPTRRRVGALAAGAVLTFVAAVTVETAADLTVGRHSALGYAAEFGGQLLGLGSLSCLVGAVRGLRARRMPR